MKNIVLIGLMGCGKTTIAKRLSGELNRTMIDVDEYLVTKNKQSINKMFSVSEDYFRLKETECYKDLTNLRDCIISTGGGVVTRQENIDLLKKNSIIIYIDRPIDKIMQDVETSSRPLLKDGPGKLYELYNARHQLYLDACDIHLINNGKITDIVEKILIIIN